MKSRLKNFKEVGQEVKLYSIAETAKANNLKTFEYFQYLMEQILVHLNDDPRDYMESIIRGPKNYLKTASKQNSLS